MIGKKFARLTVKEELPKSPSNQIRYLCICDCAKETVAYGHKLRNGSKKSCGCLQIESAKSKIPKMIEISTKFSKLESIQIAVWRDHYNDGDISFENFLHLSQQNCYYCDSSPGNKTANFQYNGLDRINSDLPHNLNNSVPCCIICNRGKNNSTYQDTILWMQALSKNFHPDKETKFSSTNLPTNPELKFVRDIFRTIRHKTTDLSLEEFHHLSQLPCHYCNRPPFNRHGSFLYSGLDRIDSFRRYLKDNVVPCCKNCNFAKGNQSLQQFSEWIERLRLKRFF